MDVQIESRPHKEKPLRVADDNFSTPLKLDKQPYDPLIFSIWFPAVIRKYETYLCYLYLLNPFILGCTRYFDYLFYVDLEASMADPNTQNALENLKVHFLG